MTESFRENLFIVIQKTKPIFKKSEIKAEKIRNKRIYAGFYWAQLEYGCSTEKIKTKR